MTEGEPKYWFPAKRYGWGWSFPVSWQGWAVLVGYLVLILGGIPLVHARAGNVAYLVYLVVLTVLLVVVCWLKGEPVRWRWGK
jgi:hypothetical protein